MRRRDPFSQDLDLGLLSFGQMLLPLNCWSFGAEIRWYRLFNSQAESLEG